jgi:hypothetical protein
MASVLKVDKLDPQSGTALEIGTSGDTLNVPSGVTLDINSGATLDATGATITGALTNTPSFSAQAAANQDIAYNTWTDLILGTENWDSDSAFASNIWTPGVVGKYFITAGFTIGESTDTDTFDIIISKNDATNGDIGRASIVERSYNSVSVNAIIDLDADDTVRIQVRQAAVDTVFTIAYSNECYFQGFRLIGV